MAAKVPGPSFPRPPGFGDLPSVFRFLGDLVRSLTGLLTVYTTRVNLTIASDGSEAFTGPPVLPTYTVAGVPSAATYARGLIFVSNETGGATVAFSDGTNWRRVQDRAIVS